MKFIGISTYEPLKKEPEEGDIIIVDYTRKGIVPDDFRNYGHGRNQYVCETVGGSGEFVQLKVLYDLNRNTPYLGKNSSLYVHIAIHKGEPHVETASGAPALKAGWITREYIKRMIDEYKRKGTRG